MQTWANDHLYILNFNFINDLWTTATCQQRPLILDPSDGRGKQAWLFRNDMYSGREHWLGPQIFLLGSPIFPYTLLVIFRLHF